MAKNPEVRIYYAYLLFDTVSRDLIKLHKYKPESYEFYVDMTGKYNEEWAKNEQKILSAMQDIFGLTFYRSQIDVALAPFMAPISQPITMNFRHKPDLFCDVLTHELLHVILTDNQKTDYINEQDLITPWKKLYGDEHLHKAIVHIPVHAGLKYIYLDILNEPKRLERDIKRSQAWPGYKEAWDYVEANDYKKILTDLKEMYAKL